MIKGSKSVSQLIKKTTAGVLAAGVLFTSSGIAANAQSNIKLSDIQNFWAVDSIQWAVGQGIVTGYDDGTFRPQKKVTQAEFLSMLLRAYPTNSLPSVEKGSPWDEAIWQFAGQMNWKLSDRYKQVTRGGVADIIGSSLGYACSTDQNIQVLYNEGLSNGKHDKSIEGYAQQDGLTRAEAVVFIKKMTEEVKELRSKPAASGNCPVIPKSEETKGQKETPQTIGSYTVSSTSVAESKLKLTAKFSKDRAILVRVTKGDTVEKEVYTTKNKQLDIPLFLRHGAGKYQVEIFEKDIQAAGSYQGVVWGDKSFVVQNLDKQDRKYLLPTAYVQSDHPRIIELAQKITKDLKSDAEKTKAIHDWVAKNIAYDVKSYFSGSSKIYTSTEILDRKMDVCTGYASLTLALNRAVGIKTRMIIGTAILADQGETWAKTDKKDNHAWVEAYVGGKWIIQDPTWNAGYLDGKTFTFEYSDRYYNPTAAKFAVSHRMTEVSSM